MEENNNTPDVKEKIVTAARELFTQNGFNGTSVRDIASASETNVAMVNYYFRSKHNLFADIFNDAFAIVTGKIFEIVESDLPFFEMIRKWVYAYYDVLGSYPGFPLFVLNELSQRPESLSERINLDIPYQIFKVLNEKFEEEQAKGTIIPMTIQDFGINMVSLCLFPFVFSPVAHSILDLSEEEYKKFLETHKVNVADFVINGLRVRKE